MLKQRDNKIFTIFCLKYIVYLHLQYMYGPRRKKTLSLAVCEQRRRRLVCASLQSDQCLCYLLIGKCHHKTCCEQNFTILAIVSVSIIVSVAEHAGFGIT